MNKEIKTMDRILILLGITVLIFTGIMIYLYITTGAIPDTLCTCFFVACTGECGCMGWIKSTKEKYREHKWQEEQENKQRELMKQMEVK